MNQTIQQMKDLFSHMDCADLSPLLENGMPRWPTHPPLVINPTVTHERDGYYCQTIFMPEHIGTHVDAPYHIHPDMPDRTVDTYPANILVGPAVTYPICRLGLGPGQQATAEQILAMEREMGDALQQGDILLLRYDWDKVPRRPDEWKDYSYNAPGLDESAVKLFYERGVRAVGSDSMTCDQSVKDAVSDKSFGHDVYWLRNGIPLMEGLVNLDQLPARSYFFALPLKIKNGSGSPIRCIAYFERSESNG